jgi:hypothetical protein
MSTQRERYSIVIIRVNVLQAGCSSLANPESGEPGIARTYMLANASGQLGSRTQNSVPAIFRLEDLWKTQMIWDRGKRHVN